MESDDRLLQIPELHEHRPEKGLRRQGQEYPPAYSPYYDDDALGDSRSIREYFNVVYKRLPIILALTIVTTAAVAIYMYGQRTVYQAAGTMIIEPPRPKATDTQSVMINFGYDQNYYNTQLRLIESPELMKEVVVQLGLYQKTTLGKGGRKGIVESLSSIFTGGTKRPERSDSLPVISTGGDDDSDSIKQVNLTPRQEEIAQRHASQLGSGLRVNKVEGTNLVSLLLSNSDPKLAERVVDTLAEVFRRKSIDLAMSGQKKALGDLEKSIADLQDTITSQEQRFIDELKESNLPVGDGKVNDLSASRLDTVSRQLLAAIDERRKLEAEYAAALQAKNPYALSDTSGSLVASQLREIKQQRTAKYEEQLRDVDKQIKDAETNLAKLRVRYTDEYSKVKEAMAEVAKLKQLKGDLETESKKKVETESKALEKEVQKEITSALKAKLATARRRESQLVSAHEKEVSNANLQGQAETKLTTLRRKIETNRKLLDTYIQRQKEQELSLASGEPDNIKVSGKAVARAVGPNRSRNILIAFFISLVGGIGISFLLDYLDDSIKSSDDIGRSLGLPTLGLIPHQKTVDKKKLKMLPGVSSGATASTEFVSLRDNRSAMAEAYRHLRTSLLFSSAGKPPETILVTSSQPSEGKTTTAINTAITLAQSGADVVLIDCDLRRPRLHSLFDMDNSHGLTNYLSGEKNTEYLLKEFPTLPNLKVITSGPIPPNPAELLSSNEMKHLLQYLKGDFKHIVIDSPPAISFTDAAIISTLVDGVVLVAMAGRSSIHLMRRFKQRLANMGARVYGVVLNGIKPNSIEYGYYGYGYTYNYYEHAGDESTPLMEEDSADVFDDEWVEDDDSDPVDRGS